jgi:hypothetical protein
MEPEGSLPYLLVLILSQINPKKHNFNFAAMNFMLQTEALVD